jgi:hypothetical protein
MKKKQNPNKAQIYHITKNFECFVLFYLQRPSRQFIAKKDATAMASSTPIRESAGGTIHA